MLFKLDIKYFNFHRSQHDEGSMNKNNASSVSSECVFSSLLESANPNSAFYVVKFWANLDSPVLDDSNASFLSSIV